MSDTLIFSRPHQAPTENTLAPVSRAEAKRRFAKVLDATAEPEATAEVIEATPAKKYSLLELINVLLADEPPRREHLLALRAQLRRYASGINVLSGLLAHLSRNPRG